MTWRPELRSIPRSDPSAYVPIAGTLRNGRYANISSDLRGHTGDRRGQEGAHIDPQEIGNELEVLRGVAGAIDVVLATHTPLADV